MANEALFRWQLLFQSLTALSAEPDDQIASLEGGHPDELGLDFGDAFGVIGTLQGDGVVFSQEAMGLLSRIDSLLAHMSGTHNADLWTVEALRGDAGWAEVRSLAREALGLLPPSP